MGKRTRDLLRTAGWKIIVAAAALTLLLWGPFGLLNPDKPFSGPREKKPRTPPPDVLYPEILVTADWLNERLPSGEVMAVDARTTFRGGVVAHSLALNPWTWDGNLENLPSLLGEAGIDEVHPVVCYTDSLEPAAAGALFWLLETAGHPMVRVLDGGLEAWVSLGYEIEATSHSRTIRFGAQPDTSRIADYSYVQRVFGAVGHTLMDPRNHVVWGNGHIPHSLPFPLEKLVRGDGDVPDGREVRLYFEEWGPRQDEYVNLNDEIIVGGDVRPSARVMHPYLAARLAGLSRVRVYPEGFSGWRRHIEAPIVRLIGTPELARRVRAEHSEAEQDSPPGTFALLDLRAPGDYAYGHLPGAINLGPEATETALEDTVFANWGNVNRTRFPLVVYCYGPTCIRSRNLTTLAARGGFLVLEWYREGVEGWEAAGEKLAKSPG